MIGHVRPRAPSAGPGASELLHHWRVSTVAERTADEMALLIDQLLDLQGLDIDGTVTGIAVASVVPRLRAAMREMTEKWFKVTTVIVEPGIRTGMPILYDNPKEVGADRIADAVAAFELYGGPTIVVDFGTATTFEVVSAKGEYLGGVIMPGIEISLDALFARAAAAAPGRAGRAPQRDRPRTPSSRSSPAPSTASPPRSTGSAPASRRDRRRAPWWPPAGLAGLIAPVVGGIDHHEPWLTLHGLRHHLRPQPT